MLSLIDHEGTQVMAQRFCRYVTCVIGSPTDDFGMPRVLRSTCPQPADIRR